MTRKVKLESTMSLKLDRAQLQTLKREGMELQKALGVGKIGNEFVQVEKAARGLLNTLRQIKSIGSGGHKGAGGIAAAAAASAGAFGYRHGMLEPERWRDPATGRFGTPPPPRVPLQLGSGTRFYGTSIGVEDATRQSTTWAPAGADAPTSFAPLGWTPTGSPQMGRRTIITAAGPVAAPSPLIDRGPRLLGAGPRLRPDMFSGDAPPYRGRVHQAGAMTPWRPTLDMVPPGGGRGGDGRYWRWGGGGGGGGGALVPSPGRDWQYGNVPGGYATGRAVPPRQLGAGIISGDWQGPPNYGYGPQYGPVHRRIPTTQQRLFGTQTTRSMLGMGAGVLGMAGGAAGSIFGGGLAGVGGAGTMAGGFGTLAGMPVGAALGAGVGAFVGAAGGPFGMVGGGLGGALLGGALTGGVARKLGGGVQMLLQQSQKALATRQAMGDWLALAGGGQLLGPTQLFTGGGTTSSGQPGMVGGTRTSGVAPALPFSTQATLGTNAGPQTHADLLARGFYPGASPSTAPHAAQLKALVNYGKSRNIGPDAVLKLTSTAMAAGGGDYAERDALSMGAAAIDLQRGYALGTGVSGGYIYGARRGAFRGGGGGTAAGAMNYMLRIGKGARLGTGERRDLLSYAAQEQLKEFGSGIRFQAGSFGEATMMAGGGPGGISYAQGMRGYGQQIAAKGPQDAFDVAALMTLGGLGKGKMTPGRVLDALRRVQEGDYVKGGQQRFGAMMGSFGGGGDMAKLIFGMKGQQAGFVGSYRRGGEVLDALTSGRSTKLPGLAHGEDVASRAAATTSTSGIQHLEIEQGLLGQGLSTTETMLEFEKTAKVLRDAMIRIAPIMKKMAETVQDWIPK